jgi:hypothetical protein
MRRRESKERIEVSRIQCHGRKEEIKMTKRRAVNRKLGKLKGSED